VKKSDERNKERERDEEQKMKYKIVRYKIENRTIQ
jgi:hypothetical protein